jgi:hypothetical protein
MAKIRQSNIDPSMISGQTALGGKAAEDDYILIYDSSNGTLKKVLRSNFVSSPPEFSSITPTNVVTGDGTGNVTFTITGSGFVSGTTAILVTAGGANVAFASQTLDSSTQITGTIAISSLSNANEPYGIQIIGGNGLSSQVQTNQITIDAQPVFETAAGSLGTLGGEDTGVRLVVNANDPESAGVVTYELFSGSLPGGLSLSNESSEGGIAVISGDCSNPVATTTYNFTLRASDVNSNTSTRAFSITVNRVPQLQTYTTANSLTTFAVPSGLNQINEIFLVAAGGQGGGWQGNNPYYGPVHGGGGGGGLIYMPNFPVAPGGTISVHVGSGDLDGVCNVPGPNGPTHPGRDSFFGKPGDPGLVCCGFLVAKNGGGGGRGYPISPYNNAGSGGSGGGGGNNPQGGPGTAGTGTQPTQPGNSGAYGFGNPGAAGPGGGGGAGAAATNSNGAIGKAYTIADGTTPVYYSGGGGATNGIGTAPSCEGGGGSGTQAGQANTGGGGGGGPGNSAGDDRRAGGSGIIIMRY